MRNWMTLAAALLVAACAVAPGTDDQLAAPPAALLVQPVGAGACRIGPNDGPVLAERGIGGTGMPATVAPVGSTKAAPPAGQDRGIGGTGLSAGTALASAGIAGQITGFASICVNGVEVQYSAGTPVSADGLPASNDRLRAGQIVVITAAHTQDGLQAQRVEIRHEVVGPIWGVTPQGFIVAGQRVILTQGTRGSADHAQGWWLAVSGLRNMRGDIVATRLDSVPPGRVIVHGALRGAKGKYWIGALPLRLPADIGGVAAGESVTVTGSLVGGVLLVSSARPDLLYQDPEAYFGTGTASLLIEAYSAQTDGMIELPGGWRAPAAAPPAGTTDGPGIFLFTRGANGALQMHAGWAPQTVAGAGPAPAGAGMGSFGRPVNNMTPMSMPGGAPFTPGFGMPGMGFGGGMGAPPPH